GHVGGGPARTDARRRTCRTDGPGHVGRGPARTDARTRTPRTDGAGHDAEASPLGRKAGTGVYPPVQGRPEVASSTWTIAAHRCARVRLRTVHVLQVASCFGTCGFRTSHDSGISTNYEPYFRRCVRNTSSTLTR